MAHIFNYILLFISLLFGVTKNIVSKSGGKAFSGLSGIMTVNTATAILALVVYSVSGLSFLHSGEPAFIVFALFYGMFTLGSQSLYILAVKDGSVSVCSLIYASCFMIPTVFSALYFDESFSALRVVGILLILASILSVSYKGGGIEKGKGGTVFAILAMLCAGSVGIIQKLFGSIYGTVSINEFLFLSFLFMLIISATGLLVSRLLKKDGEGKERYKKGGAVALLALSASVVFANKLNIILAAAIPGLIFFPVINGGTIIASTILSRYIFKERLSTLAKCGIITGLCAMVLIAL